MLRRVKAFAVAASLVAGALSGCSKDPPPPPPSGLPPLAGEAAPAAPPSLPGAKPGVHAPAGDGEGLPPGHPTVGGGGAGVAEAMPPGHPAIGGGGAGGGPQIAGEMPGGHREEGKTIDGAIDVAPALRAKVAATDIVFLSARVDDGSDKGGAILAVKRFEGGALPLTFELDGRDAMSPGTKLEGKVLLVARVDKDGDAMTHNAGDLLGVAHVTVPAKVKLTVDKVLP